MNNAARALGRKIAFYRTQRGLSQRDFGALIDRSETWVSQVERGVRRIDRMTVLVTVADALGVPLNEIAADTPVVAAAQQQSLPGMALRMLFSSSLGLTLAVRAPTVEDLARLRQDCDRAWQLVHAATYAELLPLLTELIPQAEAACRSGKIAQRRQAFAILAKTYHACAAALVKLGEIDSAWIAADRAIIAADRAEDPLLMAAGAFRLAHVFEGGRHHDQAAHAARTAAEAIMPLVKSGDPKAIAVAGALRLLLATVAARVNDADGAHAELEYARQLAQRLGEDRNDYDTEFGPTNVQLHEVAVAVELGDAGTALRIAAGVQANQLSAERHARMLIDVARAHLQRRNATAAIHALLDAERLTPEQVRQHRLVKNIVYDLARSEHKTLPQVRGLAGRCGVYIR